MNKKIKPAKIRRQLLEGLVYLFLLADVAGIKRRVGNIGMSQADDIVLQTICMVS